MVPLTVGKIEQLTQGDSNPQTILLADMALRLAKIEEYIDHQRGQYRNIEDGLREIKKRPRQ